MPGHHISELHAAEARYRRLLEHASDAIYSCDANGCFVSVNPTACHLLQYEESELIGRHFLRVVRPDDRDRVGAHYARQFLERIPNTYFELPALAKDGRVVWFGQNVQLAVEYGRVVGIQAIAREITQQKAAEEALRRSEERYRSLVHDAPYGIYRSTLDGRLLEVNPALVSMLGYDSMEELKQLDIRELYRDPAVRERLIARHGAEEITSGIEVDWKRRDGTPLRVRISVRAVAAPGAEQTFEGMVENVTERRALEERLRQARQMEALGRLARGIAHDFNNVLAAIEGSCDLLTAHLGADNPNREEVEAIQEAAERGAALTRRLLAFSRREPAERRPLDLRTVVQNMSGMLRRLAGDAIAFTLVVADQPLIVLADPSELEQILLNLTVNARDAMPQGGALTITLDRITIDEGRSGADDLAAGDYARLSVQDTGVGVPPEIRSRIFEPFFTTKEPERGGGLGLSIVYSIVRDRGGSIRVTGEPGRGAEFEILLPAA